MIAIFSMVICCLTLDFLKEDPAVYENQQYIDIYLVRPCIAEQHSISFFSYKFEKEGEKKFEGGFRSFCFFFCMLVISLWKLELYWNKICASKHNE